MHSSVAYLTRCGKIKVIKAVHSFRKFYFFEPAFRLLLKTLKIHLWGLNENPLLGTIQNQLVGMPKIPLMRNNDIPKKRPRQKRER